MAEPRLLSPTPENVDISAYYLGLKTLGLEPTPQGEEYARLMEAKDEDGLPLYTSQGFVRTNDPAMRLTLPRD